MTLLRTLLLALVLLLPPRVGWTQDLPVNGDFAQGGTPPAGWFLDEATAKKGTMTLRPATGGGMTLVLAPNAGNTPSAKPYGIGQLLPANAFRGKDLVVSATLGGSGGAQAVLGLAVLRKAGAAGSVTLRGSGAPTRQEDRLTVPNDASVEGLVLFLVAEGTAGEASFAGVAVRIAGAAQGQGASTAPAPTPTGAYAPAPDMAATVRIDTTQVVRRLPRSLFGTNIEVIRDANGLWDAHNNRLDPQILALARELRLGPIRFPGGVWSDAYDWRNGVGPQDRRVTTPTHPGSQETYRNRFGTDEALDLAKDLGTSLLITVNAATGTPQMAADWVRYVNGEGGKSPRGPHVAFWQVGNELYIEGDASGGHMSPQAYADRFLAFAAAMKAVDPTIRVAAIGLRNFGRYRLNAYRNWNEVVLRKAGSAMDLLTVHDAYAPIVGDDAGLEPSEVYAAMWAMPRLVAQNLADTWQDVERVAPDDAKHIALGVTEWGPLFAVNPASPWIDHVKTLGSAIYVAATLKVFAENPHMELANFFKLNEPSFMGWIGRRGSAWAPTAPFLAFRMVSRDMEPDLLSSSVTSPTYSTRAIGFVDRVSGVPYVDALVTTSPDRAVVTALLINKSLNATANVRTSLIGASGARRMVMQTLGGPSVDANTGTELPRIPGLHWGAQRRAGAAGRIDQGSPQEITQTMSEQVNPGADVTVRVPAHSLVLLRFEGVQH
ncbi:MAG: hypothetical protein AB7O80_11375 [Acetobacteraceae bacterium]